MLALSLASTAVDGADHPARIVSMNLCTDSMLFELVDLERIASVSFLSRDPNLSVFSAEAKMIPINRGHAEEIVALEPDLVITDRTTLPFARRLLQKFGIPVMLFDHANDLVEYRGNLERLGAAIGVADRARKIVERIDALTKETPDQGAFVARPRALVYQPNGFMPGTRTLMSDLMTRAGYRNVAAELDFTFGGFLALESLLFLAPDAVVFSVRQNRQPSLADAQLSHPALRGFLAGGPERKRPLLVKVPENLWTCAGLFNGRAIEILQHAVQ